MDKCKWCVGSRVGEYCKKGAPVVMPNPNFCRDSDQRVTLTRFPDALCPCGDIEKCDEQGS